MLKIIGFAQKLGTFCDNISAKAYANWVLPVPGSPVTNSGCPSVSATFTAPSKAGVKRYNEGLVCKRAEPISEGVMCNIVNKVLILVK